MATAKTRVDQIFAHEELDQSKVKIQIINRTNCQIFDYESQGALFFGDPRSANPAYNSSNNLSKSSDVTKLYSKLALAYPGYEFVLIWKIPFGEQKPGDEVHAGTSIEKVRKDSPRKSALSK